MGTKNTIQSAYSAVRSAYKDTSLKKLYPSRYLAAAKRPVRAGYVVFLEVREKELTDNFRLIRAALERRNRESGENEGKAEVKAGEKTEGRQGSYSFDTVCIREGMENPASVTLRCLAAIPKIARAEYVFVNESSYFLSSLPIRPETTVIQTWHACGAFKKFGYQSIGTREGHSSEVLDAFNIHRNYSWVVCSGKGTKEAFAEAFSYPVERVVSLDRPEYDELVALRDKNVGDREGGQPEPLRVLMAPTLRKSASSAHPFRDLYESRNHIEKALGDSVELCWSFHPLESNLPAPGNVSSALIDADCLVTDYSSIVYEAYLLGKPTFFYVPDIRDYEVSPGLNVNPTQTSPGICFYDEQSLIDALKQLASERASCDFGKFDAFAGGAFDGVDRSTGSAASRLVDFAIGEASR